ncbi:permease-like cell division protein FtsX [Caldicellulosiruptoraceae bacterium PP1]
MKVQTFKYFLHDGFKNIFLNKTMAAASISIVVAALTIVGIFFMFALNLDFISKQMEQKIDIKIYIDKQKEDKIGIIEEKIKNNAYVKSYKFISPEMALENFKKSLGNKGNLLEGFDKDNPLRASFEIKPTDIKYAEKLTKILENIDGISEIYCPTQSINKLKNITNIIRIFCLVIVAILFIVSIFIISNTIKITMFARRREISIMKYIGATNWFIRWPFVIEGFIIGIIGSIISYFIVFIISHYSIDYISKIITFIKFIEIKQYSKLFIITFLITGGLVGTLGSIVSIRKYLKV